jgi:hypothetical protein
MTTPTCGLCDYVDPRVVPVNLSPDVQYMHLLNDHYWFFVRRMVIKRAFLRFVQRIKGENK